MRIGRRRRSVIAVRPALQAEIKFFGRHKGGAIRDGVILSVHQHSDIRTRTEVHSLWGYDGDDVIAAFDSDDHAAVEYRSPAPAKVAYADRRGPSAV